MGDNSDQLFDFKMEGSIVFCIALVVVGILGYLMVSCCRDDNRRRSRGRRSRPPGPYWDVLERQYDRRRPTRNMRRLYQTKTHVTPIFHLAREIENAGYNAKKAVREQKLSEEAPTLQESTEFTQKDLLWVIPLSCLTQAFWIYLGYKVYKRCRGNRSDQ